MITKVAHNTATIHDFRTDDLVGRHHLNNLKVFVPRDEGDADDGWKQLADQQRKTFKVWKQTPAEHTLHQTTAPAPMSTGDDQPPRDDDPQADEMDALPPMLNDDDGHYWQARTLDLQGEQVHQGLNQGRGASIIRSTILEGEAKIDHSSMQHNP